MWKAQLTIWWDHCRAGAGVIEFFMSEKLEGKICLMKRLRRNPVWERHDYGYCWVDLLLLANDQDRETFIKGEKVFLKRGQLAWSIRSLEEEWGKSAEWIERFLTFCKEHGMVKVEARKNRGTLITVLNYDAYNPPVAVTEPDTKPDSDPVTEPDTKPEWKGEVGNGNRKGERATPPENPENAGFAEAPDESEVLAFAASFPGDLPRGIPAGIPAVWSADWFRYKVGTGTLPKKWREKMAADFARDFTARHPKALGAHGVTRPAGQGGRTAAQERFELSRELEELQVRLDAAYENSIEPSAKDRAREKELKSLIKALPC